MIGRRIAEARDRAGLTQADLAGRIALARSSLAKIEGGSRRVTAVELARVAEELGTRIEWFLEEAPEAIVSRRNAQEPGAPSPRIDRMVERVARAVEFVSGHSRKLTFPELPVREMPADRHQAEVLAADARAMLGVSPEGVFTGLTGRFVEIGLLAFSFGLGRDAADAATVLLRQGGVAIINGDRQVGRRRLALAHELGHFLVADEYTVDYRVAEAQDAERRESLLDCFARALLLPRASVERDWCSFSAVPEDGLRAGAVRMASAYRVDMATLARRLGELEILDGADARKVREVRTTKADIVEYDLVVAKDELASPALPRAYERAVLGLYRDETISGERALDLLFETWEEESLPPLPRRSAGEIWQFV